MNRDITGADMFRIEMAEPYSDVYDECIAQAKGTRGAKAVQS